MKTQIKSNAKQNIGNKISAVAELYGNSTVTELLNDLVAIGTWPTPEKPRPGEKVVMKSGGSVAIDTVPLPDKPKELRKILSELIKIAGNRTLNGIGIS